MMYKMKQGLMPASSIKKSEHKSNSNRLVHAFVCLTLFSRCLCGQEMNDLPKTAGPIENLIEVADRATPTRGILESVTPVEVFNGKGERERDSDFKVASSMPELGKPYGVSEKEKMAEELASLKETIREESFEQRRHLESEFIRKHVSNLDYLVQIDPVFSKGALSDLKGFAQEGNLAAALKRAEESSARATNSNSQKQPGRQTSH